MPISGDFARLDSLVRRMNEITTPQFRTEFGTVLAATGVSELGKEFRKGVDPYGAPWAPLKTRKGGKPLRDTGRLANSFSGRGTTSGFEIGTAVQYAGPHQDGATIEPHHRAGQTMAVDKRGRFISKANASKNKGPVAVRFAQARTQQGYSIPRRQMIPDETNLGNWGTAFNKDADRHMREHFDQGGK